MKKITLFFLVGQLVIFILSILSESGLSLLSYINISFYIGGLLLIAGGFVYIMRTGSFDFFTSSMRKVLSRRHMQDEMESMRKPSEVFSASPRLFFLTGIPILLCMLVALGVYYR